MKHPDADTLLSQAITPMMENLAAHMDSLDSQELVDDIMLTDGIA